MKKITYIIWSAYKHGALFHNEFKLQGKEILQTVFCDTWMWHIIVITICLQPTHEGVLWNFFWTLFSTFMLS